MQLKQAAGIEAKLDIVVDAGTLPEAPARLLVFDHCELFDLCIMHRLSRIPLKLLGQLCSVIIDQGWCCNTGHQV